MSEPQCFLLAQCALYCLQLVPLRVDIFLRADTHLNNTALSYAAIRHTAQTLLLREVYHLHSQGAIYWTTKQTWEYTDVKGDGVCGFLGNERERERDGKVGGIRERIGGV